MSSANHRLDFQIHGGNIFSWRNQNRNSLTKPTWETTQGIDMAQIVLNNWILRQEIWKLAHIRPSGYQLKRLCLVFEYWLLKLSFLPQGQLSKLDGHETEYSPVNNVFFPKPSLFFLYCWKRHILFNRRWATFLEWILHSPVLILFPHRYHYHLSSQHWTEAI